MNNYYISLAYLFTFLVLAILLIASFLNYKSLKKQEKFDAKESKK
ncbi:MAG: heme exporter protein CcmD [Rickettsia endosymbiont of Ixodes persulcatus]|nr:heme exporter protein CcmD [Rickettsia endosymbiont of Ixodes persulcatus]MCZ6903136.1 heme exporter protein CcmD [Rickettsia endosymbiont of Ixodes persulcatus]MCZ6909292.1 heme exporter protein CcmD [Rickettsia endosymbiont of Ixodes persulcatus]MCZ6909785.1 heme exporter protein CcmD [Rickettsia endosymbiont of Ixodes persulcatus]MCZ6914029.1 heme exporter protein CcmD [Rickettsia endosymbiont of Ixodes persulcatus]